jgi:hypothetical protein
MEQVIEKEFLLELVKKGLTQMELVIEKEFLTGAG